MVETQGLYGRPIEPLRPSNQPFEKAVQQVRDYAASTHREISSLDTVNKTIKGLLSGQMTGVEASKQVFQSDASMDIAFFDQFLPESSGERKAVVENSKPAAHAEQPTSSENSISQNSPQSHLSIRTTTVENQALVETVWKHLLKGDQEKVFRSVHENGELIKGLINKGGKMVLSAQETQHILAFLQALPAGLDPALQEEIDRLRRKLNKQILEDELFVTLGDDYSAEAKAFLADLKELLQSLEKETEFSPELADAMAELYQKLELEFDG